MANYESYNPDENGHINFKSVENETWKRLYHNQIEVIQGRACQEYINGLAILDLATDRIPQIYEVTEKLKRATNWALEPVPAVIGPTKFFTLLASRKFPCASFIRTREDFFYIKEPDIFHEIFGHCPMLTDDRFARFVEEYGKFALSCTKDEKKFLFRLFWFTVEFGLIKTSEGNRIYGGGILSSIHETKSALNNEQIQYEDFDLLTSFRTPYRIDLPQKLYFVINNFDQLYSLFDSNVKEVMQEAQSLGDLQPKFPLVDDKGDIPSYTN